MISAGDVMTVPTVSRGVEEERRPGGVAVARTGGTPPAPEALSKTGGVPAASGFTEVQYAHGRVGGAPAAVLAKTGGVPAATSNRMWRADSDKAVS